MIIEVALDGRGAVRIEAEFTGTPKQIKGLVDHATNALVRSSGPKPEPIGFGAGRDLHLDHGNGSEADPTEFGWTER